MQLDRQHPTPGTDQRQGEGPLSGSEVDDDVTGADR
jgi:hypothetical protein